jgi:hypothetical protein
LNDKDCIWARTYDRLKYYHELEDMLEGPTIFYNAALKGTSAWANTFLGRDHCHHDKGEVSQKKLTQEIVPKTSGLAPKDSGLAPKDSGSTKKEN